MNPSAYKILGDYLSNKKRNLLYELAMSTIIWERRIAIVSTCKFIQNGSYDDTIRLSEILINGEEDLIHKSIGWMLREVGKKDLDVEITFLDKYAIQMPRTMLRYAVENFPDDLRGKYLQSSIINYRSSH